MKTQSLVSLSITDTFCQKNIKVWCGTIHPLYIGLPSPFSVVFAQQPPCFTRGVKVPILTESATGCEASQVWLLCLSGLKKSLLSTSASPQPPSSNQRGQGAEEEDGVLLGAMHVDPPVLFAAGKSFSHMMLRHKHICLGIRPAAVYPL